MAEVPCTEAAGGAAGATSGGAGGAPWGVERRLALAGSLL